MIDLMVSQGYTLADVDSLTLRQLFHFAGIAMDRMDALRAAMSAGGRRK